MPALVGEIEAGATVLLVSDAGMPLISDPGYRLVAACIEAGAAGAVPAGPVGGDDGAGGVRAAGRSGSASRGSRRASTRRACPGSTTLAAEPRTCVFFESPRRLADCLRDAVDALGAERRAVVCRELTKTHEEIVRGSLGRAGRLGGRRGAGRDHRRAGGCDAEGRPRDAGGRGQRARRRRRCGSRTRARRSSRRIPARRRGASSTMRFCAHGAERGSAMALPALCSCTAGRTPGLLGPHRRRNPSAGTGIAACSLSTCRAGAGSRVTSRRSPSATGWTRWSPTSRTPGWTTFVIVGHSMAGLTVPGVVTKLGASRVREMMLAAAFVPPRRRAVDWLVRTAGGRSVDLDVATAWQVRVATGCTRTSGRRLMPRYGSPAGVAAP